MDNKTRKLFVNVPVKELNRSVEFFTKLGFEFDPNFSDDRSTCMIVNDASYFMLLVDDRFRDFAKDPTEVTKGSEAIFALSAVSRAEVDELADKALANGAMAAMKPMDMDFMYGRSFDDLDGHHWEVVYMDPNAPPRAHS